MADSFALTGFAVIVGSNILPLAVFVKKKITYTKKFFIKRNQWVMRGRKKAWINRHCWPRIG